MPLVDGASYGGATPERAAVATTFIRESTSNSSRPYSAQQLASHAGAALKVVVVFTPMGEALYLVLELAHDHGAHLAEKRVPGAAMCMIQRLFSKERLVLKSRAQLFKCWRGDRRALRWAWCPGVGGVGGCINLLFCPSKSQEPRAKSDIVPVATLRTLRSWLRT